MGRMENDTTSTWCSLNKQETSKNGPEVFGCHIRSDVSVVGRGITQLHNFSLTHKEKFHLTQHLNIQSHMASKNSVSHKFRMTSKNSVFLHSFTSLAAILDDLLCFKKASS